MITYNEVQRFTEGYKSFRSGKYPHAYLFFDMNDRANRYLQETLINDGYWEWAPGRSRKYVSMHQIVAFYCLPHPREGGTEVEIHHINGNTMDNRPENLVYITRDDHNLVTRFQRKASKLRLKTFSSMSKKGEHQFTPFNRQGRTIRNWVRFIMALIALTIMETTARCEKWFRTPYPLKGIIKSLEKAIRGVTRLLGREEYGV